MLFDDKFKIPLIWKFLGVILMLIGIAWAINLQVRAVKNKEAFYRDGFSSLVMSSNSYQGRSIEFHLDNGLKIYFMPDAKNKIKQGDSIVKRKNTYTYDVYRKEDGRYTYVTSFDFFKSISN